jgi:peptidoglycan/xylan/chitin deacetylase (PgdA/CDA1 family)
MAKRPVVVLCTLLIIIGLFSGCKKFIKKGYMPQPGIALTFDDDGIDNWFAYLPILDSSGVKATFYICKYHDFTREQKQKLSIIQSHGHEIAFHTANHYNMKDYVYKQGHTLDELIRCEVKDELKLMNRDGFYPTNFAFPYGAHNRTLDSLLMIYFKSVRALNGTQNFAKSIVPTEKNTLLFGLGIDRSSKRKDEDIMKLLQAVRDNNGCAVFVAHGINTANKFSITLERLKKIIDFVKTHSLKYYTVAEISN